MKQKRQTKVPLRKNHPSNEYRPEEDVIIEPPKDLDQDARQEFARLVPLLKNEIDLKLIDVDILALYCQELAKYWRCERILLEKGYTIMTQSGYEQQRPEVSISKNALMSAKALASELGLSVLSRRKIFDKTFNPKTQRFPSNISSRFADRWAKVAGED